jgi:hypothetical protein
MLFMMERRPSVFGHGIVVKTVRATAGTISRWT